MENTGYPKFLYHKLDGKKLVKSAEEEKKLGASWVDSPAKFEEKKPAAKKVKETK